MLRGFVLVTGLLLSLVVRADMFVVAYTEGENWVSDLRYEQQPGIRAHLDYWQQLYTQEVLLMSGPFEDQTGGLFLISVDNLEMAKQFVADDPAVKSGLISATTHRWRVLTSAMRRSKPLIIEVEPDRTFKVQSQDPGSPINLPGN